MNFKITGGHVVDPSQNINEISNVGICDGKFVGADINMPAEQIIDATGLYVFPGFIDFHTHLFQGSAFGVEPNLLPALGVTTAVDAGTAGWLNFSEFYRSTVQYSSVMLKAFVNVSGVGQTGIMNEPLDEKAFNWSKINNLMNKYRDILLGIKLRISKPIVGENGMKPLQKTFSFAHANNIPVCVHVTNPIEENAKILPLFQKGDIFCHCYHGTGDTILTNDGKVLPEVWAARERGVIFDAANGRTNFSYRVARKAIAEGFLPDIISTDTTSFNFNLPLQVKNLPFMMAKYLGLGLTLEQVVRCVTDNPAKAMGMDGKIGTLKTGSAGNLTICRMLDKKVKFKDSLGEEHYGSKIIIPVMTIVNGNILYCAPDFN